MSSSMPSMFSNVNAFH